MPHYSLQRNSPENSGRDTISSNPSCRLKDSLSSGAQMTWQELLKAKRVQRHKTSKHELDGLRAVVERDLKDASLAGLSEDRRFATAYNCVLQLAKMAIACAGYRVTARRGHHENTFVALGPAVKALFQPIALSHRIDIMGW